MVGFFLYMYIAEFLRTLPKTGFIQTTLYSLYLKMFKQKSSYGFVGSQNTLLITIIMAF